MNGYQVHMNQEFLMHHGVPGQVHGKRRYQNYDGSLTPEGREHYGVGQRIKDSFNRERANKRLDEIQYRKYKQSEHQIKGSKDIFGRKLSDIDQKVIDKNTEKLNKIVKKLSEGRSVMIPQARVMNTVTARGNTLVSMVGDRYVKKDGRAHKNYEKQKKADEDNNNRMNAHEILRYTDPKYKKDANKYIRKMNDKDLVSEAKSWRESAAYHRKNGDEKTAKDFERNAKMYEKEINKRSFDGERHSKEMGKKHNALVDEMIGTSKKKAPSKKMKELD